MDSQNIAIVGLNNVGTEFLKAMVNLKTQGVNVLGVCEQVFTEGTKLAQELNVKNMSIKQLVNLGENIDVIFDLSGDKETRKELRKTLFSSQNQHTVIAPESVARLMYTMINEKHLPNSDNTKFGY